MAVELLAFPSVASARIHERGDGEVEVVCMHEFVEGIEYQSTFLGLDLIQNGEDFQREIDRILKTILLKISTPPVDIIVSGRENQSELTIPAVKCPDGHRCPYFPCPTCHRSRSIFGLKSSPSQSSDCKLDTHHALIEEDEVIDHENPSAISDASIDNRTSESFVPVLECGDGGHRCPYFPCPTCHRSRSIFTGTDNNIHEVNFSNFDFNSDLITCESKEFFSSDRVCPSLITYPDGGHKCPYFPCPVCHKNDRSG